MKQACHAMAHGGAGKPAGDPVEEAPLFIILVGQIQSGNNVIEKLEAGLRSILAIAAGCGTPFSMSTTDRRLAATNTDSSTSAYTYMEFEKIAMMNLEGKNQRATLGLLNLKLANLVGPCRCKCLRDVYGYQWIKPLPRRHHHAYDLWTYTGEPSDDFEQVRA